MLLVFSLLVISVNIIVTVPRVYAVDWSPEMRITWNPAEDLAPSLAQGKDGRIWFVWQSYRTGDYEIFYKIFNSTAAHPWSQDIKLTDSLGFDIMPSIMHANDNRTWVAWMSQRVPPKFCLYYKIFDGTSWTVDMNLTSNLDDYTPALMQTTNGVIWVFWGSTRTSPRRIFYKTSSDNGASWSQDMQVPSTSNFDEKDPFVTQSADGKIWLVFERNWGIFYKTSLDGISWSTEGTITPSSNNEVNLHPAIAQAANGNMWVVWDSDRINDPYGVPQNDIFYRVYDGSSWGSATQFTSNPLEDNMPSIMRANDGALWATWAAMRGGLSDIYYKSTSLPLPHDVGIFYVSTSKSVVALNRVVNIDYVAQNDGTNPETFTVDLYANSTLLKSAQVASLAPGDLSPMLFAWNTSGAALGNYTIMVNATVVTGETHTVDNEYIDGKVWVVVHDVAVTGVSVPVRLAYPGYTYFRVIYVNVTNKGTISENDVTVTTMYNSSIIGIQTVALDVGENVTLMFLFNTYSVSYSNYTITAEATPNQDEDNQNDNLLGGGTVLVTIPGDITGNKVVDIMDWSRLSAHWSGPPTGPLGYNLTADINEDGEVDILDMAIMSANWDRFW